MSWSGPRTKFFIALVWPKLNVQNLRLEYICAHVVLKFTILSLKIQSISDVSFFMLKPLCYIMSTLALVHSAEGDFQFFYGNILLYLFWIVY